MSRTGRLRLWIRTSSRSTCGTMRQFWFADNVSRRAPNSPTTSGRRTSRSPKCRRATYQRGALSVIVVFSLEAPRPFVRWYSLHPSFKIRQNTSRRDPRNVWTHERCTLRENPRGYLPPTGAESAEMRTAEGRRSSRGSRRMPRRSTLPHRLTISDDFYELTLRKILPVSLFG